MRFASSAATALFFGSFTLLIAQQPPPKRWIDPDTGHRIVRLTDEPGSASLYFNQNGYTADGKEMVYTTPEGISVLNLETHATRSVITRSMRRTWTAARRMRSRNCLRAARSQP